MGPRSGRMERSRGGEAGGWVFPSGGVWGRSNERFFFRAGGRATRADVGRRDVVAWQEKESYAKSHQYKKISHQYLIDCDLFFIW